MNLYRPRMGVGTKTLIALTLVFWIPVAALAGLLYNMFSDLLYEEGIKQVKIQLTGAQHVIDERITLLEGVLSNYVESSEVKHSLTSGKAKQLQSSLIEFGKQNSFISMLAVVDVSQRVITRRNEIRNDTLSIGESLPAALRTGNVQKSYELVARNILMQEDEALAKLLSNLGLVHFVVVPVKNNDEVIGALIAGMMISTNTSLGDTVYGLYGSELAVFAGTPRHAFQLHATTSLPRSTWVMGQVLPMEVHKIIVLGRAYYNVLMINKQNVLIAVEPIKDSDNRIIGAIGVSFLPDNIDNAIMNNILLGILVTSIIALIITLLSVFFVHYDITRPLAELLDAMKRFGKGDNDINLNLKTGDQLEMLGVGFNQMVENIKHREERFSKHNEVAKLFMSTMNMDELLDKTLRIVVSITESQLGIIYLWNEIEECLIPRAQYGLNDDLKLLKLGEGFPGQSAKQKEQILITTDTTKNTDIVIETGINQLVPAQVIYIPLIYQENLLGVLTLGSLKLYPEEEKQLFDYLADQISIALDNALMHQRVQDLSITDTLTGLYNRRYLNQELENEWSRASRTDQPISILLADIDNFKSINDEFGHDKGDEVLKKIANIFKENVRKGDIATRYGGEEIVALLANANHEQALAMAERIGKSVRETEFSWLNRNVTLSIGLSTYPDLEVSHYDDLINAADQSMYEAKKTGKDRVISLAENKLKL